jgi:hypothetical protein
LHILNLKHAGILFCARILARRGKSIKYIKLMNGVGLLGEKRNEKFNKQ